MDEFREGDPITVTWFDTFAIVEWLSVEDIKNQECTLVETRGFFISKTDRHIIIAGSKQTTNQGEYSSVDIIPLGCVKSICQ